MCKIKSETYSIRDLTVLLWSMNIVRKSVVCSDFTLTSHQLNCICT